MKTLPHFYGSIDVDGGCSQVISHDHNRCLSAQSTLQGTDAVNVPQKTQTFNEHKDKLRSQWSSISYVSLNSQRAFKMGETVSINIAEAKILSAMAKARLEGSNKRSYHFSINGSTPIKSNGIDNALRAAANMKNYDSMQPNQCGNRVFNLVKVAMAKERLRKLISEHLSLLSGPEVKFLMMMVDSEHFSLESLESAAKMLEKNPLYNPTLIATDIKDENLNKTEELRNVDGTVAPVLERQSQDFDAIIEKISMCRNNLNLDTLHSNRIAWLRSRTDAIESSALYNESSYFYSNIQPKLYTMSRDFGYKIGGMSQVGRTCHLTDSISDTWKLSYDDEKSTNYSTDDVIETNKPEKTLSISMNSNHTLSQNGSTIFVKNSFEESKNTNTNDFNKASEGFVHESANDEDSHTIDNSRTTRNLIIEKIDKSEMSQCAVIDRHNKSCIIEESRPNASSAEKKGIRRMSSRVGVAIDPLLSAIPVEVREEEDQSGSSDEKRRTPSSQLKKSQQGKGHNTESMIYNSSQNVSNVNLPFSIICCGMEPLTLDHEEKCDDKSFDNENVENTESKNFCTPFHRMEIDFNSHLSTWLGTSDDYPILGVKEENYVNYPLEAHVLTPLLMKCLREHLPYALKEENFWLKYSMIRDGGSIDDIFSLLKHSQHTILAIETSKGDVLGSFTSSPWRNNGDKYYGSSEAFVWNLRKSRTGVDCDTLDEYILRETSVDVYPWKSRGNQNVQLSNSGKLFVGGGEPDVIQLDSLKECLDCCSKNEKKSGSHDSGDKSQTSVKWGMALALGKDLMYGTTCHCATFESMPLIYGSYDNEMAVFEVRKMEIWTLTPCMTEELAEELELGRSFITGMYE